MISRLALVGPVVALTFAVPAGAQSRQASPQAAVAPDPSASAVGPATSARTVRRPRLSSATGTGSKLPPAKPAEFGGNSAAAAEATAPAGFTAPPTQPVNLFAALFGGGSLVPAAISREEAGAISSGRPQIDALIRHHAKLNGVPESLVHRIVIRESRYNPRAVGRGGAMGLMQIKTATARGMGYGGGPEGLLDAETNITYAVKYLAGAFRTADGNHDRAVSNYARGYYYEARRKGLTQMVSADERPVRGSYRRREANATRQQQPLVAAAPVATPAVSYARNTDDRSAR